MIRGVLIAGLVAFAAPAQATPVELRGLLDAARPAGCAQVSFLVWDFYRAELWTDAKALPGSRYGLSLTYRSAFSRDELVQSSIDEMARISGRDADAFEALRPELHEAFRDVAKGDRITAWRAGPDDLRFFYNGAETGRLTRDVDLFLDIWLGRKARDKDTREALLSGQCNG